MSSLFLARLQFGLTVGFHFLFRIGPILWHLCRYPAAIWDILQDSTGMDWGWIGGWIGVGPS